MPYIQFQDRGRFRKTIETVLKTILDGPEPLYIKGEYFGYFVNRMCRKFQGTTDYTHPAFNSTFFEKTKQKTFANSADSVAATLNRADPLGAAGELNYVISAVYWGLLGLAYGHDPASYGLRTYLRSMLRKIRETLNSVNTGSQQDATMAFRRHLVITGVLDDVIDEGYRRHTAVYEDEKMGANGDIWLGGELMAPKEDE